MQIKIISDNFNLGNASVGNEQDLNRGAMFGDGFFTTAVVNNGNVVNRDKHLARLKDSAERLNFNQWQDNEHTYAIEQTIDKVAKDYPSSVLRISCSRKQKERGYAIGDSASILCEIHVHSMVKFQHESCYLSLAETPISVNAKLAGIKHLNRLDNVLAASECESTDHEVLMCNKENVICGSRSNLFIKLDGRWITPLINDCGIEGIMKSAVIENMKKVGVECLSTILLKEELVNISSAFITNSIVGIWPVRTLDKRMLDLNCAKELQQQVENINSK